MEVNLIKWAGFSLSFLAAFFFSLFHISLGSFSRISLSRFLENKEKAYRFKILQIHDEIKISVGLMRIIFLIAFLVYFYSLFPRLIHWPLWLFLLSLAAYFIFFDLLPRLINALSKKKILGVLLPSYTVARFVASPLLRISRIESPPDEHEELREATDEEIEAFIDEARQEGIIETGEGGLLKSVVEFGDTVVREIMTPRVDMVCIRKDAAIEKLRELVIKEKRSRVPVYKDRMDNIEGIVNAKDLLEYVDPELRTGSIEPLIRPVHFVPESMKVPALLKEFQKRKQKLAIVVDEHGGVAGLVTMEDLVEEIVGEIQDEYDREEVHIIEKGPHDYIVSGEAEVEEIEDLFGMELAEDDYITLGGLITHSLGRLPIPGEKIQIKGLFIEMLEVDQKRIKKLRVKKPSEKR